MKSAGYYYKCIWSRTRYACRGLIKLEFSRQIFKKNSKFVKIRPARADFFIADGRTPTDMTKQSLFAILRTRQ